MLANVGHIIVVDDDTSLRQMVIRFLEEHNIPAKSASNGAELKRHFEGAQPSLIIDLIRIFQSSSRQAIAPTKSIVSSVSNSAPTITS
jgi:two-component system OmpR family response regulator